MLNSKINSKLIQTTQCFIQDDLVVQLILCNVSKVKHSKSY